MESDNVEFMLNTGYNDNNIPLNSGINSLDGKEFMKNQRSSENWYSDDLSATVAKIIDEYEEINVRLQTTSITDILAGIRFDSGIGENESLYKQNLFIRCDTKPYNVGLIDIDPLLTDVVASHPHLKPGHNEITNALFEDDRREGCVWKDNVVRYNNAFDPRLSFQGLQFRLSTNDGYPGNEEPVKECTETLNSFLGIVNPSGFANTYLNQYQQFLRDLRNESKLLAVDNLFKVVDQRETTVDMIESRLHANEEKAEHAPYFVGNECENIDLWSQITSARRVWSEEDHCKLPQRFPDDDSTKSVLVALFSGSYEDLHFYSSDQHVNAKSSEIPATGKAEPATDHVKTGISESRADSHEQVSKLNNYSACRSRILSRIIPLEDADTPTIQSSEYAMTKENEHEQSSQNIKDTFNRQATTNDVADKMVKNLDVDVKNQNGVTSDGKLPETILAVSEAGDFTVSNDKLSNLELKSSGTSSGSTSFIPWSTANVENSGKSEISAQTSMFWSHQQRCHYEIQHQQQQELLQQETKQQQWVHKQHVQKKQQQLLIEHPEQLHQHHQLQKNQHQQQQNKQPLYEQQQCKLQQHKHQQQQKLQQHQQQQELQQQQHQHQQKLHQQHQQQHQQQQKLQQQQKQHQHQQQYKLQQHHQQQHKVQQPQQQQQHKLHHQQQRQQQQKQQQQKRKIQQQQQQTQQQQQQQRRKQQQIEPQQNVQYDPYHLTFQQQYNGTLSQHNERKYDHPQCYSNQEQWAGIQQDFEQSDSVGGSTLHSAAQSNQNFEQQHHQTNSQQPPYTIENDVQHAYQTNAYYPNVHRQYATSTYINGGQTFTNQNYVADQSNFAQQTAYSSSSANWQQQQQQQQGASSWQQQHGASYGSQSYGSFYQPPGITESGSVLNLNFVHSKEQHQDVKFDDEVWYINGVPHQHAKPLQQNTANDQVPYASNHYVWPQNYNWNANFPNVVPQQYVSTKPNQDTSGTRSVLDSKNDTQKNYSNRQKMQNAQININNNNGVNENVYNYDLSDNCANKELDAASESESSYSLSSSRSQHSFFKLSDVISESSRESLPSELPDSLSEFSDAEEETGQFVIDKTRDNFGIGRTNVDYSDECLPFDSLSSVGNVSSRRTDIEEIRGRNIKVLSGRSNSYRERIHPQRKSRNSRASHLITII